MPLYSDWPQLEIEDRSYRDDSFLESGARDNDIFDTVSATLDSYLD